MPAERKCYFLKVDSVPMNREELYKTRNSISKAKERKPFDLCLKKLARIALALEYLFAFQFEKKRKGWRK